MGIVVPTKSGEEKLHIDCLLHVFNDMARPPQRDTDKPMRMPISGIYKIKGVGDVLAGRVEQGLVKPGEEVVFMPTHTSSNNRTGNVMIYKKDSTLKHVATFNAQIQVLDIPGEIKKGYSPIGFVRCGRAACRIVDLKWKMGKETGGKKADEPHALKSNEMAEIVFEPCQPLVVDSFKNCEGLSRIAFLDGNGVVMLGKVVSTTIKEETGKKK